MFLFRGHLLLKPRRLPGCLLNFSILILKWTFLRLSSAPFAVAQQLMLGKKNKKKKKRDREREDIEFWRWEVGLPRKFPRGRTPIVKNPSFLLPPSLSLLSFPPPNPTSLSPFLSSAHKSSPSHFPTLDRSWE